MSHDRSDKLKIKLEKIRAQLLEIRIDLSSLTENYDLDILLLDEVVERLNDSENDTRAHQHRLSRLEAEQRRVAVYAIEHARRVSENINDVKHFLSQQIPTFHLELYQNQREQSRANHITQLEMKRLNNSLKKQRKLVSNLIYGALVCIGTLFIEVFWQ